MLSRFGLLLNTVVKIRRKKKGLHYCKMRHIERQNDEPKMPTKGFSPKSENTGHNYVHLNIVKMESRGQPLPVIKKRVSGSSFNLEKSSFVSEVLKTCFYPNHRRLNSYTFALSRIKIKNLYSTINNKNNKESRHTSTLYNLKK